VSTAATRDWHKTVSTQDRHKAMQETLARRYERWEEADEFNT